jgi:hypothetical protein
MNVFDCETYQDDNKVIIYCVSYSINNNIYSIYFNQKDIIITFFDNIVTQCSEEKIIFFIHNINFDGMLIMETVFKYGLTFD